MLEVTGETLMRHPKRVEAAARRLKERGLKIAIDDLGTGYSPPPTSTGRPSTS